MSGVEYDRQFGLTVDQLKQLELVFRPGLMRDQVILVSGAGSGMGQALAITAARLGADLVICGRDAARLDRTRAELEALGARVLAQPMTIRDPGQVTALMQAAWERFGKLDHLFNVAGGHFAQPAIDFSIKGWLAVIDTNLNGSWYMMQQAAKRWISAEQAGNIVNITLNMWRGAPGIAHSAAARAGVIYLSRTLAVEWAPHDIRVNCVAPGIIETAGYTVYGPEVQKRLPLANPMRHAGSVMDIVNACLYLAAPSGKFITGETITVDGGQQLWGDPWLAGRPDHYAAE